MSDEIDALQVAREQLDAAVHALAGTDPHPELRVQLGLLAAQVALAERLSSGGLPTVAADFGVAGAEPRPVRVVTAHGEVFEWNLELATRVLARSAEAGVALIRVLVAEGGKASVERVLELSGRSTIQYMQTALTRSASDITRAVPIPQLVGSRRSPDPEKSRIVEFFLLDGLLPLVTEALRRVDVAHGGGCS